MKNTGNTWNEYMEECNEEYMENTGKKETNTSYKQTINI